MNPTTIPYKLKEQRRLDSIQQYKDEFHCIQTYNVYKFQPEKLNFTACCETDSIQWDPEAFDLLGDDYFTHHPQLLKRREDLKNNIKHPDCRKCWKCEEFNLPSARLQTFNNVNVAWGMDINKFWPKENASNDLNYVKRIEIWPESTCNLGCHMCHIGNSTILQKIWSENPDVRGFQGGYGPTLSQQYPHYFEKYMNRLYDFVFQSIKSETTKSITIAYLGGEPTIQPAIYKDAKKLLEMGKHRPPGKHLAFSVVTNGMAKLTLNNKLLNLYKNYLEQDWMTTIMVSQDAVGDQAQVRHLCNPEVVRRNFCSYLASPYIKDVTSFTVLSNLNLPYIDKMAKYLSDSILNTKIPYIKRRNNNKGLIRKKGVINFNTLTDPDWMMLRHLPKRYAIDSVNRALDIFNDLIENHDNTVIELDINIDNLKQQASTLQEVPPYDDIKHFIETSRYVESVYSKYYPNFNFDKYFPHVKDIRRLYE